MDERQVDFSGVPWAPGSIALLLLGVLALSVPVGVASGVGFAALALHGIIVRPGEVQGAGEVVGQIVHLSLALWLLDRWLRRRDCRLSAVWGRPCRNAPLLVGAAFAGISAMGLQWWLLGGNEATSATGWCWILMRFAGVGVLAPAVEEMLFRGLLYASLRRRLGVTGALGVSLAAFMLYHPAYYLAPWRLAFVALAGICSALLLERTRSLTPCVAFHAAWNSLAVLLFSLR